MMKMGDPHGSRRAPVSPLGGWRSDFRALSARTRYLGRSVTVSDATHRLYATGVASKLLPDPADNGVDDIAASRFTVAPDLVEELGASDGVTFVQDQMLHDCKLEFRQRRAL